MAGLLGLLGRLASNPFAGNILGMPAIPSAYASERIDALTVDVVVAGDRVRVVEPENGRCLTEIRQPALDAGTHLRGSDVQVPLRKRAPERLTARQFCPISPNYVSPQEPVVN